GEAGQCGRAAGGGAPHQGDGQCGHASGLAHHEAGGRLGEGERGDQPNAQASRDVREEQRHARHVDGGDRTNAVLREVVVEQRAAAALTGQPKHGLAPQSLRERSALAAGARSGRVRGGLIHTRGWWRRCGPSSPGGFSCPVTTARSTSPAATKRTPAGECVVTISKRTGGSSSSRSRSTGARSPLPR